MHDALLPTLTHLIHTLAVWDGCYLIALSALPPRLSLQMEQVALGGHQACSRSQTETQSQLVQ